MPCKITRVIMMGKRVHTLAHHLLGERNLWLIIVEPIPSHHLLRGMQPALVDPMGIEARIPADAAALRQVWEEKEKESRS